MQRLELKVSKQMRSPTSEVWREDPMICGSSAERWREEEKPQMRCKNDEKGRTQPSKQREEKGSMRLE